MDWKSEFFKLLATNGLAVPSVGTLRSQIESVLDKWISGKLNELEKAAAAAILDGQLTDSELIGLLKILVRRWTGEDLTIDSLDAKDIGKAAISWAATRVTEGPLRKLIQSAADGSLASADVRIALINWVDQQAPQAKEAFAAVINSAPNQAGIVQLVVALLIGSGKLSTAGNSLSEQQAALLAALANSIDPTLRKLLVSISQKDWASVAKQILSQVGVKADEELIQQVLSGNGAAAILAKVLGDAIPGLTTQTAKDALAQTVLSLLKGESVVSAQSEQEALGLNSTQYAVYQALRRIFYAAALAAQGNGPVVPTAAMAQPHVFAMAAITSGTLIKSLVPASALSLYKSMLAIFMFPGLNTVNELDGNPHVASFKETMPFPKDATLFNARTFGVTFIDAATRLELD